MQFTANKPVDERGRVLHDADLGSNLGSGTGARAGGSLKGGLSYRTHHFDTASVPKVSRKQRRDLANARQTVP